ncbi:MAG: pyridoxal phosphate-dependent aminotransferase [Clostridia bacterium]|nr:pyridoxal phosphate-dependent aminotransferase [Clostridia bacterium]
MFSSKMLEMGKHGSVIREIAEHSKMRKAEIGDDKVFDFSIGNPSIPCPEKFNEVLIDLIKNTDPVELHSYTAAQGDPVTRRILAENIEKKYAFKQTDSLIYMTCGASSSLSIVFRALLEEDDEVIAFAPYFPEYKAFIENAGGILRVVGCNPETLYPNFEELKQAINRKTKAVIINSPTNPTGSVIPKETLEKIASTLTQASSELGTHIYIVADEPYREVVYDGVEVPYVPTIYPDTVVCNSYSKSLSVPGERIGYIAISPKSYMAEDFYYAVCGAGRGMGYICAPSLLQRAIAICDSLPCDVSAYDKNRRLLYNSLIEIGYTCVLPQGAFYLFVKALEPDANAFARKAREEELLLVPSDSFGVEGWVRIAYCTSYEQIEKSLPAFKKLYESYKVK